MATKSDDVRRSPVAALIYGAPIGLLGGLIGPHEQPTDDEQPIHHLAPPVRLCRVPGQSVATLGGEEKEPCRRRTRTW